MRDYSPKRRTAVVFAGTGTAGAYHAGVLKALDEAGVKLDLLVGSGIGGLAAAFGAVAGGAKLHGSGGFWDGLTWEGFFRVRPLVRAALTLLAASMCVLLLPIALGLLAGLLSPLLVVADLAFPGLVPRMVAGLGEAWHTLRVPYLAALVAPIFLLSLLGALAFGRNYTRDRRRGFEALEFLLDGQAARQRLAVALWDVARGGALGQPAPAGPELGQRYVSWLSENLGQPGFRELIVRTADLETGRGLPFVVLEEVHLRQFVAARSSGGRARNDPGEWIDLRAEPYQAMLFDGLVAGMLPPLVARVERVTFPRTGLYAGETHRLSDATLLSGCGIGDALAAGAEQVIVVAPVPERTHLPARRRGPRALVDALLSASERQALEQELQTAQRFNRIVETLGHRTEDGRRAWQDPATGRTFREVALYVVRPERRPLQPLELSGAEDPQSEVFQTLADVIELGYRDAYRQFVEPVVGAAPDSTRPPGRELVRAEVEL